MFRDKLKKIIEKNQNEDIGNDKRKVENLIFFIIILIITIFIINIVWNGKKSSATQENNSIISKQLATTNQKDLQNYSENSDELESKLQNILSKIQGVGQVNVFINYSESSEVVAMYNENSKLSSTEENDTSGGIRKIEEKDTQKEIIYQEDDNGKTPITQKIIQPRVEGAIITAKGADNISVKTNIIQAVEAVTGLATHKIQVFEMN